jgi:hypothetical protein
LSSDLRDISILILFLHWFSQEVTQHLNPAYCGAFTLSYGAKESAKMRHFEIS